mgnify:CR=1 FL=1
MINRELIRIKVVQLVYAYYQNSNRSLDFVEKELLFSLSKSYELYAYLLQLIIAITNEERHRFEVITARSLREGTEPPSDRFVNNRFAVQLEENIQLAQMIGARNLSWQDDVEYIRSLCDRIEQTPDYQAYMALETTDYDTDRELWRKLYKMVLQNNESLESLLEEKSIYWNDDKDIVDTFVIKTIKRFDPGNGSDQPLLPEFKDEDDRKFAVKLFREAVVGAETYQQYMAEASRNWDLSRLAYMDLVIMQIALAEMLTFPNIPVSVTINEYVDLAKVYSTPKSGSYINGMLDSIARHLAKEGILLKPIANNKQ